LRWWLVWMPWEATRPLFADFSTASRLTPGSKHFQ
jgi:hypothetical protein